MDGIKALNELLAETGTETEEVKDLSYKHKVTGPIYGGELQVDRFGICICIGEGSLSRFYNGQKTEIKRLIEVIPGKIWVRDERFG